jgi:CheY-like chemotaxis protein
MVFNSKRRNDLGNSTSQTISAPKGPLGRRATVLVVDDEELVRYVTQELLTCLGYDSVAASSGEEAVEKIRAGLRPDLVLLDIVMAGMGGVEAFRSIRRMVPSIPVLLSSGFTDPEAAAMLRNEGLNGVISKPYRMESLSARIREVLG